MFIGVLLEWGHPRAYASAQTTANVLVAPCLCQVIVRRVGVSEMLALVGK